MNENDLYVVKNCKFDNPLNTKIDFRIDFCYRDCHNKYFQIFECKCIYDIKLTNITDNEIFNLRFSGKSMNLYKLNKESKVARYNGFIFNQVNKLTKKCYWHLRYIKIS